MDVRLRLWDDNSVQVRFWASSFIGLTTANNLLQHFTNITEPMNHSSIIYQWMDLL